MDYILLMKDVAMETKITASKYCLEKLRKWEKYAGMVLGISVAFLFIESYLANKQLFNLFGVMITISIGLSFSILCVLFVIHWILIILGYSSHHFLFKNKELQIDGVVIFPENAFTFFYNPPIYYSIFQIVSFDSSKHLRLLTDSSRLILEMSLEDYPKEKIEQILQEFQRRDKLVKISPELYGVYSTTGENKHVN